MNRRKFLQLTSFTSLGLFLGVGVISDTNASTSIIPIGKPIVHGRHGLFNLANANSGQQLVIQRDILTRDGLDVLSNDRITTIRINHCNKEHFQVINNSLSAPQNGDFVIQKVSKSKPYIVVPATEGTIVFSECTDFKVNATLVQDSEACVLNSNKKHTITSEKEQFILVYQPEFSSKKIV